MTDIVLIAHNIRSSHNVGSLLRTAEGLGITHVYLTGYTPYPTASNDTRLPHVAQKIDKQISKTALGAEKSLIWQHEVEIESVMTKLMKEGYTLAAIEQTTESIPLPSYKVPPKIALLVGNEVEGIDSKVLTTCQVILEIPMFGHKESFNVAQAAAIAMYHCRFYNQLT